MALGCQLPCRSGWPSAVRGVGPALSVFGVNGVLADPVLSLINGTGATVGSNDDWGSAANAAQITAAAARVGAFALPPNGRDSALLTPLGAGSYTAQVTGKGAEEMAEHREIFREGAAKNGLAKEKADEIFDLMEKFAGYGFNKSHAAAYALLSYHTAYLKVHFPAEFMAANLSLAMDDTDKIKVLVEDATASYFPEFKQATLAMVRAQGGIVGWTAGAEQVLAGVTGNG